MEGLFLCSCTTNGIIIQVLSVEIAGLTINLNFFLNTNTSNFISSIHLVTRESFVLFAGANPP
jgi:hypothetical protein